jgi:hypothetical protein
MQHLAGCDRDGPVDADGEGTRTLRLCAGEGRALGSILHQPRLNHSNIGLHLSQGQAVHVVMAKLH